MIRIPSKSQKAKSQLLDALRILAWSAYKSDNKDLMAQFPGPKRLEFYQQFEAEWKLHEIQAMELPELQSYIKDELGYSERELAQMRERHYQSRNGENPPTSNSDTSNSDTSDIEDKPAF